MENKVISREYVKKNYIHKDIIKEIIEVFDDKIYESNGGLIDLMWAVDYLQRKLHILEDK